MNEHFLLFDVGGTDIKAGLADSNGEILQVLREPTRKVAPEDSAEVLVSQLQQLGTRLQDRAGAAAASAGLIVCGLVDADEGIGIFSANLGWRNAPLKAMTSTALGLPVGFGHDVSLAARAELELGSGAKDEALRHNAVVMIIGTGIATALMVDGRLISAGGYAGELGHSQVPGGFECPCGATGCLETVGSAGAIAKRYFDKTGLKVGAKEVFAARAAGDEFAASIINDAVEALTFTMAQLCSSVAPEGIVLGGGLAQAGPEFFAELEQSLECRLSFHRRPRLISAHLGADAGLQGALILAREASGVQAGQAS
ncbi:glucokinase [Glutamicibacter uratoxydans]|uniref:Glucokinase n=1 Tax=Glutamicibacter uratoxydans TaxID=43667 RepID=A0A4Y4DPP1_GLUUR|nr:ROK family protein [Glutamicibacter uratoxydans]GED06886.1 glucokinase [Glutamicibacter uratoxydans]